jgi:hypothetical protein
MFQTEKREIANLRADYATPADFCKVLESDMKSLYLLAFLLTANHKHAEQCFASTVDAALQEQAVFKAWARSWVKRSLIKNAIQIAFRASGRDTGKRDLWSLEQQGMPVDGGIDGVTRLAPLDRFIFVMSVLERYTIWECSLLLGCDMKKVIQVRTRALRGLAGQDAVLPRAEAIFSRGLQATA